ncbi:MAG: MBL fold metallo-hydrolase [Clostridiales bacterium]|nr:MBL fold metallo-hydrolase [Clostridiales bacterium]
MDVVVSGELMTNCYIIGEGGSAIIVDPGTDFSPIKKYLERNSLIPKFVLVTHAHFDHIGSVAKLKRLGAKVYMSKIDYSFLQGAGFYDTTDEQVEPFEADVLLNDGDEFTLLNHGFRVLSTPGHTPGGACYVMDGRSIFSGDTLFKLTVGRWDFKYGNGADLVKSLKKLFALSGDYEVYPGHGDKTTLDFERKYNPYATI